MPARFIVSTGSISNYRGELEVNPVVTAGESYCLCIVQIRFASGVVVVSEEIPDIDRPALIHISPGIYLHLRKTHIAEVIRS